MLMKWARKNKRVLSSIIAIAVLAAAFGGFGGYLFKSDYDTAIVVNKDKISYKQYQKRLRQVLQQSRNDQTPMNEEKMKMIRQQTAQSLIQEALFLQEAEKFGVVVTNNELAAYIQRIPAFHDEEGRFDQHRYFQILQYNLRSTTEEFEEQQKIELTIRKFQSLMSTAIKITTPEFNWHLQQKMAASTPKKQKELKENLDQFRDKLRQEEVSHIFQNWFAQVGSTTKVKVMLDRFQKTQQS